MARLVPLRHTMSLKPSRLKSCVFVLTFHFITKLATLTVPMPVAKSQPVCVGNAGR
jgi:hypothetical protein